MNSAPILSLALLATGAAMPLAAQDVAPRDSERDPVLTALLEAEAANGPAVTVDLSATPGGELGVEPDLAAGDPAIEDLGDGFGNAGMPDIGDRPEAERPDGVTVEVVAGASTARIDAADVKLLAPFPAKPLSRPPAGWKLVQPQDAPARSKSVELANGSRITLAIRPHLMIPEADGANVLQISEPGFDPADQYAQEATLGAILADTIMDLDEDSVRLNQAVDRLEQLLTTLPSEPHATSEPTVTPAEAPIGTP